MDESPVDSGWRLFVWRCSGEKARQGALRELIPDVLWCFDHRLARAPDFQRDHSIWPLGLKSALIHRLSWSLPAGSGPDHANCVSPFIGSLRPWSASEKLSD